MTMIRDLSKHIRSSGQKLTADNINSFGQKAMNTAHVIGRKFSNTLKKIENIGERAMPVLQTVESMAGYPELGALASAGKGLSKISQLRGNVDTVRNMINGQYFFFLYIV